MGSAAALRQAQTAVRSNDSMGQKRYVGSAAVSGSTISFAEHTWVVQAACAADKLVLLSASQLQTVQMRAAGVAHMPTLRCWRLDCLLESPDLYSPCHLPKLAPCRPRRQYRAHHSLSHLICDSVDGRPPSLQRPPHLWSLSSGRRRLASRADDSTVCDIQAQNSSIDPSLGDCLTVGNHFTCGPRTLFFAGGHV